MAKPATPPPGIYSSVQDLLKLRLLARDLTLQARRQSRALLSGSVRTRYRGRGMEFAEVRPYQPGDDIRTIDWRVTARVQEPYTKLFQEEHERPVFIMVDQRSPMFFGSQRQFKSTFAAQLAAVVAWTAHNNNDRVGALIFGDQAQSDLRAKRGKHPLMAFFNKLSNYNHRLSSPIKAPNAITLEAMLREANRVAHPGSLMILISDFHDYTGPCAEPLAQLSKRSDLLVMHLYDPLEAHLPTQQMPLTVSNGQERVRLGEKTSAERLTQSFNLRRDLLRKDCRSHGVQYVDGVLNHSVEAFVSELFKPRKGKKPRILPTAGESHD